ncbi:MAG: RNA polymerase sigma factor [Crocosphaera sp.]
MSLVYLEYANRKNHIDSELRFLLEDFKLLSSSEQKKFYSLMNHISYCMKNQKVDHVAEFDILVKVYQKALETIIKEPIYNPYGWLKTTVTRKIKDIGRKYWGKETIEYKDELGETLLHRKETNAYTMIQMRQLIDLIFESLSDLNAQILYLHKVEGYTLKEVSEELGKNNGSSLSYSAVRKRYSRMIEDIKENDDFQSIYQSLF